MLLISLAISAWQVIKFKRHLVLEMVGMCLLLLSGPGYCDRFLIIRSILLKFYIITIDTTFWFNGKGREWGGEHINLFPYINYLIYLRWFGTDGRGVKECSFLSISWETGNSWRGWVAYSIISLSTLLLPNQKKELALLFSSILLL